MPEHVFSIFEGPDAGKTFALSDKPMTIGHEKGRDVVLHDDRVSRLHARLLPEGDRVVLVDENSSNGTFVNGVLVARREIRQGDVISIGASRIVFGPDAPGEERLAGIAASAQTRRRVLAGQPTEVSPPAASEMLHLAQTRLSGVLEAVAEAARPVAEPQGIHISVELELRPDLVSVDPQQIYVALAGMLSSFLRAVRPAGQVPSGEEEEATLALRTSPSPSRAGVQIEMIWIGPDLDRDRVAGVAREAACLKALEVAQAHRGRLEFLPLDSPDVLARLRLPLSPSAADRPTVIET